MTQDAPALRLVFLDVDGVLNSAAFWEWRAASGLSEKLPKEEWRLSRLLYPERFIDSSAVSRLNRLLRESGARVVMSSTWRTRHVRSTRTLCRDMGMRPANRLIGVTPHFERWQNGVYVATCRGEEIQAWLDAHGPVERFVILDDDADMAHLTPHLVQTDNRVGLTDADVAEALRRLT